MHLAPFKKLPQWRNYQSENLAVLLCDTLPFKFFNRQFCIQILKVVVSLSSSQYGGYTFKHFIGEISLSKVHKSQFQFKILSMVVSLSNTQSRIFTLKHLCSKFTFKYSAWSSTFKTGEGAPSKIPFNSFTFKYSKLRFHLPINHRKMLPRNTLCSSLTFNGFKFKYSIWHRHGKHAYILRLQFQKQLKSALPLDTLQLNTMTSLNRPKSRLSQLYELYNFKIKFQDARTRQSPQKTHNKWTQLRKHEQ